MIAGAGIGGLTAALSLLRQGFAVAIYEQAPALGEIGAGLQLSANATRVLNALGLAEALAGSAVRPQGKEMRHWRTGRRFKLFDLGVQSEARYGAPYLFIHRADLHRMLAEAVLAISPRCLTLSARCVGIDQRKDGVRLLLADGRAEHGTLLIGADGVHSGVRASLFGTDRPQFTGCMAWRGVIPRERLRQERLTPEGSNWIGPGRHVVTYPLRRGELLNFVGVVENSDWRVESWTAAGTREECLADFVGWHEEVRRLIAAIDVPYKWALMVRTPMARWSMGRVTLLGDACHAALPFLAQGAAMAIEDACLLARSLAHYRGDHDTAFARYEAARIARTTRVITGSADNMRRFHDSRLDGDAAAEGYIAAEFAPEKVAARYEWLFGYDALTAEL
jgi:salicylate hydroxylase